jgi:hypothetical protein
MRAAGLSPDKRSIEHHSVDRPDVGYVRVTRLRREKHRRGKAGLHAVVETARETSSVFANSSECLLVEELLDNDSLQLNSTSKRAERYTNSSRLSLIRSART